MHTLRLLLNFYSQCPVCKSKKVKNLGLRYDGSQGLFPCAKGHIALSGYKCLNCDTVFSNPMPINTQLFYESENPLEYFDTILTKDDINQRWKSIVEFVQEHLKSWGNALDVGAGIGLLTQFLAQEFAEVIAIEPSRTFFKMLKENLHNENNIRVSQNTFEEFSQNNTTIQFDFIFIHEVLEHVPNPIELLSFAKNMLRENGIIYVCVPNNRWLTYDIVKLAYSLTGRCFTPHLAPLHPPFHLYEFSKRTFRYIASTLNLEVVAMRTRTERTYVPGLLHSPVKFLSKLLDKGYEVEVILKKST